MTPMKLFMDTHDAEKDTFPKGLSSEDFAAFFAKYEEACAEGVVILRVHVGLEAGRAFCFALAPDQDAVRRAHETVGLAFDSITEVKTASPGNLMFAQAA